MAIYIPIWKTSETGESVVYEFGDGDETLGIISLNKGTGKMEVIGSKRNADEFYYRRAMRKLYLHWEKGEFPEKTAWSA
jgi:hypothetical protein